MAEKRGWLLLDRFGLFFTIVLGVVMLVIGLIAFIDTEKAEVTAQVVTCDELTTYHPELEAKFTYAGEEVAHLWKLGILFVNSGNKTLIGAGSQSNILSDGLNFVFPDNTRILRAEEGTDTFEGGIVQTNPSEFQIQFSQWRSDEYIIGSFYVASEQPLDVAPCPTAPSRDIIDGDIIIENLVDTGVEKETSLIDRMPTGIPMFGKIIGILILAVCAVAWFILVVIGWKPVLQLRKWKTLNLESFSNYLDEVEPPLSEKDKRMFKKRPYRLPEKLWANFKGKRVPVRKPTFGGTAEAIYFTFFLLISDFGAVIAVIALTTV